MELCVFQNELLTVGYNFRRQQCLAAIQCCTRQEVPSVTNEAVKSVTLQTKPARFYYNLKLYNGSYSAAAHCG